MPHAILSPRLLEQVLARLNLPGRVELTPEGLKAVYHAWCHSVPFDNIQKLIHVRNGKSGPLPGSTAEDFFSSWLEHGTGGTCWAGSGALAGLLNTLGFQVERGIGTMLIAPDLPPNHGTVRVKFEGGASCLVDSSILHHEPLVLHACGISQVNHQAWGVKATRQSGRWHLHWRPLHMPDGFVCRYESFGQGGTDFEERYEQTRGWSPFNYQLYIRQNRSDDVAGIAFGNLVQLRANGLTSSRPVHTTERIRMLVEDFGYSEEIATRLPPDIATPPPPGSRKAQAPLPH